MASSRALRHLNELGLGFLSLLYVTFSNKICLSRMFSISSLYPWPLLYVTSTSIFSTGLLWMNDTLQCQHVRRPPLFELCFELLLTSWLLASLADECCPPASFSASPREILYGSNIQNRSAVVTSAVLPGPCTAAPSGLEFSGSGASSISWRSAKSFSQHRETRNNSHSLLHSQEH